MINEQITSAEAVSHVYYSNPRHKLVSLLDRNIETVLEIGCGTGETLVAMKNRGALRTVGIELRSEVAQIAKSRAEINEVHNADFLHDADLLRGEAFDVVILSHVLEHFPDPTLVLSEIKRLMHSDSRLLLAVPNIRHVSALIPLVVRGEFEYVESGILDNTHLRFFTRSSISNLALANGFDIQKIEMDYAGPRSRLSNRLSFGLFNEFLAYAINLSLSLRAK
jgi:2-polyprenyl-3-methyl-5-hydroxy-6-metoxy-1,4-benzoquinol methylase